MNFLKSPWPGWIAFVVAASAAGWLGVSRPASSPSAIAAAARPASPDVNADQIVDLRNGGTGVEWSVADLRTKEFAVRLWCDEKHRCTRAERHYLEYVYRKALDAFYAEPHRVKEPIAATLEFYRSTAMNTLATEGREVVGSGS